MYFIIFSCYGYGFLTTDAAVFFKALLLYIYSCSLLSRELGSTPLLSSGATVTPTGRDREVSAMSKKKSHLHMWASWVIWSQALTCWLLNKRRKKVGLQTAEVWFGVCVFAVVRLNKTWIGMLELLSCECEFYRHTLCRTSHYLSDWFWKSVKFIKLD